MAATRLRSASVRWLVSITFPARPTACRSPDWQRRKPGWQVKAGTPRCDAASHRRAVGIDRRGDGSWRAGQGTGATAAADYLFGADPGALGPPTNPGPAVAPPDGYHRC